MAFSDVVLVDDALYHAGGHYGSSGGGRHLVRGGDGTYHAGYLASGASGNFQLWVVGFTVDNDDTVVEIYNEKVANFAVTDEFVAFALDIDTNSAPLERLLCLYAAAADTAVSFKTLDTATPAGGWTARNTFNHGITHSTSTIANAGFQIIGRQGGAGNIHAVYVSRKTGSGPNAIIKHRTLATMTGSWSGTTSVDTSATNTTYDGYYKDMSVCADTQGDLHCVWCRRDTDAVETTIVRYSKYTGSWTAEADIYSSGLNPVGIAHYVGWVDVCCDVADNVHVVMHTGDDGTILNTLVYLTYAGSWSSGENIYAPIGIPPSTILRAYRPSIGTDMEDAPYVFWGGTGFGANFLFANPLFATRATGSWVVTKILDEADAYQYAAVPHNVWPYTDSSTTMTNPLLGVMTGRTYDNDLVLFLEDAWTAGHEPRAELSIGMSFAASGVNATKYAAGSVGLSLAIFANVAPDVAIDMALGVTARRAYTAAGSIPIGLAFAGSGEFLASQEGVISIALAFAATEAAEINVGSVTPLTISVVADNYNRAETIALTMSVAAVSGGSLGKSTSVGLSLGVSAIALPPEGCATTYVPDPALPATPDSVLSVVFRSDAGLSVTMRRPSLGDGRSVVKGDTQGKTADGTTVIYTTQAQPHRLTMNWTGLTRRQLLEIEDFLETTAADEITYTDHHGHDWRGYITNYPNNVTTHGREQGRLSIVFEGSAAP